MEKAYTTIHVYTFQNDRLASIGGLGLGSVRNLAPGTSGPALWRARNERAALRVAIAGKRANQAERRPRKPAMARYGLEKGKKGPRRPKLMIPCDRGRMVRKARFSYLFR